MRNTLLFMEDLKLNASNEKKMEKITKQSKKQSNSKFGSEKYAKTTLKRELVKSNNNTLYKANIYDS